jgi:hypothetical protein
VIDHIDSGRLARERADDDRGIDVGFGMVRRDVRSARRNGASTGSRTSAPTTASTASIAAARKAPMARDESQCGRRAEESAKLVTA